MSNQKSNFFIIYYIEEILVQFEIGLNHDSNWVKADFEILYKYPW